MKSKYYKVLFKDDDNLGVGHVVGTDDLIFLPDEGRLDDFREVVFVLKNGTYPDYLSNDLGFRLCSERMRELLAATMSPDDVIQWLGVTVRNKNETRKYFIIHFPSPPDVLDKARTIYADSFVVKAVLRREVASKHNVFAYPKCGKLPLIVSDVVKKAVKLADYSGMEFSEIPVF